MNCAGEKRLRTVGALPLSYRAFVRAGFEPATTRVTSEVTATCATGQGDNETRDESELTGFSAPCYIFWRWK